MTTESQVIELETATYEELKNYGINLLVIENQPELYSILQGHLLIERTIESLIKQNTTKPEKILVHKLGLKVKLDIADALGIFPHNFYYQAAKELNNIRNGYAHYKNDSSKITFEKLNSFKFNWSEHQNYLYKIACNMNLEEAVNIAIIFLIMDFFKLLSKQEDEAPNELSLDR